MSHIKKYRRLNNVFYQKARNRTPASLRQIYGKMWVDIWLNTEKRFIAEISSNDQWEERNLLCKIILLFQISSASKRSVSFSCGQQKIKWLFLPSTFTVIFCKMRILCGKLTYVFWVHYTPKKKQQQQNKKQLNTILTTLPMLSNCALLKWGARNGNIKNDLELRNILKNQLRSLIASRKTDFDTSGSEKLCICAFLVYLNFSLKAVFHCEYL